MATWGKNRFSALFTEAATRTSSSTASSSFHESEPPSFSSESPSDISHVLHGARCEPQSSVFVARYVVLDLGWICALCLLSFGLGTTLCDDVWNADLLNFSSLVMCHQPRFLPSSLLLAQRPCLRVFEATTDHSGDFAISITFVTIAGAPHCWCGVCIPISPHNVYLLANSILTLNMSRPTAFQRPFLQNSFISNLLRSSLSLSIRLM